MHAEYLFQQDKHYDVKYDTGDKVIQCGRHNDIFKFWLQWRAHVRNVLCISIPQLISSRHKFLIKMKCLVIDSGNYWS